MRLLLIVMLCSLTSPSIAEVYRWTDDNGNVIFGDTPPKDKTATAINIENTKKSGAQFATPNQVKDIERNANKPLREKTSAFHQRIDSYCRRYVSELNRVEIFLEHSNSRRDQNKARDLRKLISKECDNDVLTRKFDDGRCTHYRKDLNKTELFLEHTSSPRDEQKIEDLKKQIARECQ